MPGRPKGSTNRPKAARQADALSTRLRALGKLPTQTPEARESARHIIGKFHQTLGDNLMEAERVLRDLAFGRWVEEFVNEGGEEVTRRVYQEKSDVRAIELYIKLFTGEPKKIVENIHELGTGAQNTLADMIAARAKETEEYYNREENKALMAPELERGAGDVPAIPKVIEGVFSEVIDHAEIIRKLNARE